MENIRKAIESHGGEVDLKPMTQFGTRLIGKYSKEIKVEIVL